MKNEDIAFRDQKKSGTPGGPCPGRGPLGLAALVLGAALTGAARGQSWVTYDASLGTLPQAQCFEETNDTTPFVSLQAQVIGGDLYFSTMSLQTSGSEGGGFYWWRDDVDIDFAAGFSLEARVRIVQSHYTTNPQTGWPRPGYTLAAADSGDRVIWAGLGSGRVFLSNTSYGQFNSANTVDMAFDTTDQHHTYRIDVSSTGAVLSIDGTTSLFLSSLGPAEWAQERGFVYFGDPTYWANSEAYTSFFRFTGTGDGPITNVSGPDPASTCPFSSASFSVVASGTGTLVYAWQIEDPGAPGTWTDLSDGPVVVGGDIAADISGSTTPTVTISPHDPSVGIREDLVHGAQVRCIVSNGCDSTTSQPALLSVCRADHNCDGFVDGIDSDQFNNDFENPDPDQQINADYNGDGFVDGIDSDQFNNDFEEGCP